MSRVQAHAVNLIWIFFREEEDQIVTPFAQILATLKDVRSNLATMVSMQVPTENGQSVSGSSKAFLDKFRLSSKCQGVVRLHEMETQMF